jgi:DNA-binding transcriptional MerR regulator
MTSGAQVPSNNADQPGYTIDELAVLSQVPSRTIRFYQSAGALPRPELRGRVAYYGDAHVERLKLVADLQDRGLRMKAICNLLEKIERGELDLAEWLGFDAQLGTPWADDSPRVVTEAELSDLLGPKRPGLVARLQRTGMVQRRGDAHLIPSPGLLQLALRLEAAGVDLETAATGLAIIRKHAARAASDLAKQFFKQASKGFGRGAGAGQLAKAVGALRATSQEALRLVFAQEMERVLRELVESGKTTALPRGKRRGA